MKYLSSTSITLKEVNNIRDILDNSYSLKSVTMSMHSLIRQHIDYVNDSIDYVMSLVTLWEKWDSLIDSIIHADTPLDFSEYLETYNKLYNDLTSISKLKLKYFGDIIQFVNLEITTI